MPRSAFRIGTSGWIYRHWRERFYPADLPSNRWFAHYASVFDTVEINYTFYRLPEAEVFDQWRKQAPPGFLYAVKASRFLTHHKKLNDPEDPLERLLGRLRNLKDCLGPILFHLPPRWKRNLDRLRRLFELLPAELLYAVEFRDPDWLVDETYELLEQHRICLCVHDRIAEHPRRITGPALYVRFHGGPEPGGGYRPQQLRQWADWLREVASPRRVAYVYFNNDLDANAIRDAQRLREYVA